MCRITLRHKEPRQGRKREKERDALEWISSREGYDKHDLTLLLLHAQCRKRLRRTYSPIQGGGLRPCMLCCVNDVPAYKNKLLVYFACVYSLIRNVTCCCVCRNSLFFPFKWYVLLPTSSLGYFLFSSCSVSLTLHTWTWSTRKISPQNYLAGVFIWCYLLLGTLTWEVSRHFFSLFSSRGCLAGLPVCRYQLLKRISICLNWYIILLSARNIQKTRVTWEKVTC